MTTTGFDEYSSEEGWGPRSRKSRRGAASTATIALGAAALFSATLMVSGHFSVPFMKFIGDADQGETASLDAAPFERPAAPEFVAGAVQHVRAAARGDRVVASGAAIEKERLASGAAKIAALTSGRGDRLRAPSAPSRDSRGIAEDVGAGSTQKFADLDMPTAGEKADALRSALRAANAPVTLPSERPEVQLASLETDADKAEEPMSQRLADSMPLPSARPEMSMEAQEKLASLAAGQNGQTPLEQAEAIEEGLAASLPDEGPVPMMRPARPTVARVAPAAPAAPRVASAPVSSGQQATTTLAYAPPSGATDDGASSSGGFLGKLFGGGSRHAGLPGPGSGVAVYDIKSATVYMPSGERLEAHSGLGHMKDNPRFADQKMRGPTPPNVYKLVMRESRFHGVEAVRLLPADGKKKFGRDGLLAHTYMYKGGGGISQSNGCVVFKDYDRFLAAFKRGRVNRMVVVPDMSKLQTYMAAL